jgi:hypothetical protein
MLYDFIGLLQEEEITYYWFQQDGATAHIPNNSMKLLNKGSRPGLVKWDLWWTKWRWGRFSPCTSVSPANLHSTNCSTNTLIYHLGL